LVKVRDAFGFTQVGFEISDAQKISECLLCLAETAFVPDHDDIVNVQIHITLAKAVELDLIITIDIHPETILPIEVERTMGAVSFAPGMLEIDAQETLRKVDSSIDVFR